MSNRVSMPSLDKTEKKINIRNETLAKLEVRANAAGVALATLMNMLLDEHVKNDPYTPDMKARADELYTINLNKRNTRKAVA